MNERGTRTLTESLSAAMEAALLEVRTATPARVESYSASDQRATVLPLLKRKTRAGEVLSPKPVGNVPVLFPRAGGYAITFPVAAGDVGLLLCSDRSLDLWLASDGGQVDPQDGRHHQMTDGVFLPGLHSWSDPIPGASATDMVLMREDGSALVQIGSGLVEVGAHPAAAWIARADFTDARISAIQAKLDSLIAKYDLHTHLGVLPGPAATAPPLPTEVVLGPQATVAATKGKVT